MLSRTKNLEYKSWVSLSRFHWRQNQTKQTDLLTLTFAKSVLIQINKITYFKGKGCLPNRKVYSGVHLRR